MQQEERATAVAFLLSLLLLLLLLSARAQRGSDSGSHSTRLPSFELRKLKICTSTKLKLLLQHRHPSSSFSFFRSCNWDLKNSTCPGYGYPTDNSIRLVEIRNCTLGKYVAPKLVSPKYFLPLLPKNLAHPSSQEKKC